MKISIITPVFNAVTTIRNTIESVAGQRHADIEHIVVDGGSTDGTLEAIADSSGRISRVLSGPDSGIYSAMNKGLRIASGEVVAFLNADDFYEDEEVVTDMLGLMSSRHLDAAYADVAFVSMKDAQRTVRVYSARGFRPDRIGWGWMPPHPSLFVRRSVYEHLGGYDERYRIAGDFEFVARMFTQKDIRTSHLPRVVVRMRMGGVSTGGLASTILLNKEVLRACRQNGIRTSMFRILSKYPAKALEFVVGSIGSDR